MKKENVVYVGRDCPAEQAVVPLTNQKGKEEIYCWAKPNLHKSPRGFTLIELLVVVLIIGILAAVAVPQYQKAVDQSKFVKITVLVDAIRNAQKVFYLANGRYASNWGELDGYVELPNVTSGGGNSNYVYGSWGYCMVSPDDYGVCGFDVQGGGRVVKVVSWGEVNKDACYATKTSTRARQICQAVTRKTTGITVGEDLVYYFLL